MNFESPLNGELFEVSVIERRNWIETPFGISSPFKLELSFS
jgi:hypothetical protein